LDWVCDWTISLEKDLFCQRGEKKKHKWKEEKEEIVLLSF
jgi:hypothetical protein